MSAALAMTAVALLVLPSPIWRLQRLRPAPPAPPVQPDAGVGPLAEAAAYDLLAVCLRSGLPVVAASSAVAAATAGPVATTLGRVADLLALGTDPVDAWQREAGRDYAELAALVRRTASSGAAFADGLIELAQRCRDDAQDTALAQAERAGIRISGPLGLCFLPAFICLGIVPVVIGLASSVLGEM